MKIPDWTGANCAGVNTDLFFPASIDMDGRAIKPICAACNIQADCLSHSMREEPLGIWAGLGPSGRRNIYYKLNRCETEDERRLTFDKALVCHQHVRTIARRLPVSSLRPDDFVLEDNRGRHLQVVHAITVDGTTDLQLSGNTTHGGKLHWRIRVPSDVMVWRLKPEAIKRRHRRKAA
jgi:hypothetical protein